ncbi:uncharacterized protein DUF4007 [Bosea sp. AK1]|uniref:DUF4007 family protein n=1 Tax=Bosea sp. AK1 TaxID=2587160 RepID=UPI001154E3F6|nr:DUF4007 family protein [Bosea sp. AK1]TQI65216.1 uncharacterized protein DUF4007 [Bosea sp. AK1]
MITNLDTDDTVLFAPRFSGHESFAFRYAWLPKAYRALSTDPGLFVDEEKAMLVLGIGKNMVRSLRFWVEAVGIATPLHRGREFVLTPFGHSIFGREGLDPYLEDHRTLWLLHWKLSSRRDRPLFAWDYLIGRWPLPEFSRSEALSAFQRESRKLGGGHTDATLGQHLDVFLHTYLPSRNGGPVEDTLDGPLVGLALLIPSGERHNETGHREPVYTFRREPKPDIDAALFDYCVMDYWKTFSPGEETLSLRQVAVSPGSPGQVFKLPEDDIRSRLEDPAGRTYAAPYSYQASAVQGLLTERRNTTPVTLDTVYGRKPAHA